MPGTLVLKTELPQILSKPAILIALSSSTPVLPPTTRQSRKSLPPSVPRYCIVTNRDCLSCTITEPIGASKGIRALPKLLSALKGVGLQVCCATQSGAQQNQAATNSIKRAVCAEQVAIERANFCIEVGIKKTILYYQIKLKAAQQKLEGNKLETKYKSPLV